MTIKFLHHCDVMYLCGAQFDVLIMLAAKLRCFSTGDFASREKYARSS
jgi:hypothetical protein